MTCSCVGRNTDLSMHSTSKHRDGWCLRNVTCERTANGTGWLCVLGFESWVYYWREICHIACQEQEQHLSSWLTHLRNWLEASIFSIMSCALPRPCEYRYIDADGSRAGEVCTLHNPRPELLVDSFTAAIKLHEYATSNKAVALD